MQAGFAFSSTQPPKPVLRACEKIAVWLRFWARPEVLDDLLTHSAATLIHEGLVSLHRVALDGMRVRASAAAGSFRRRKSLEECQAARPLRGGRLGPRGLLAYEIRFTLHEVHSEFFSYVFSLKNCVSKQKTPLAVFLRSFSGCFGC